MATTYPTHTARKRLTLREDVRSSPHRRVDESRRIIYGVKVLGRRSNNGRIYPPEVIRKAAPLYEGKSVRVDHPDDPDANRSSDSVLGWLRNVRVQPDGCLYADLHYLHEHPFSRRLVEAARRNPRCFGLSHNADGDTEMQGNTMVVKEILEVRSVDLVADPATTTGLFESVQPRRVQSPSKQARKASPTRGSLMKLREWFDRTKLLPGVRRKVRKLMEMGYMDGDMPMKEAEGDDMPLPGADTEPEGAAPMGADDPADMDPADALRQGFRAAMVGVLDDTTLDVAAKVKRLTLLLKRADELLADGEQIPEQHEEPDGDEVPSEDKPVMEQDDEEPDGDEDEDLMEEGGKCKVSEQTELRMLRAEKKARALCEANGIPTPSTALLEALASVRSDSVRMQLIEEHRGAHRRAVSAPAWLPGGAKRRSADDEPKNAEEFADRLLGR